MINMIKIHAPMKKFSVYRTIEKIPLNDSLLFSMFMKFLPSVTPFQIMKYGK